MLDWNHIASLASFYSLSVDSETFKLKQRSPSGKKKTLILDGAWALDAAQKERRLKQITDTYTSEQIAKFKKKSVRNLYPLEPERLKGHQSMDTNGWMIPNQLVANGWFPTQMLQVFRLQRFPEINPPKNSSRKAQASYWKESMIVMFKNRGLVLWYLHYDITHYTAITVIIVCFARVMHRARVSPPHVGSLPTPKPNAKRATRALAFPSKTDRFPLIWSLKLVLLKICTHIYKTWFYKKKLIN